MGEIAYSMVLYQDGTMWCGIFLGIPGTIEVEQRNDVEKVAADVLEGILSSYIEEGTRFPAPRSYTMTEAEEEVELDKIYGRRVHRTIIKVPVSETHAKYIREMMSE